MTTSKQTKEYKKIFAASIGESFSIARAIRGSVCHITAEAGNEAVELETVIPMAILNNALDSKFFACSVADVIKIWPYTVPLIQAQ